MRDLLTGLAIILVVVLTTMLVAPYFVDWNGQRGVLEAQLGRALGQKVTIGGDIDLKLLPTPYLRLNQTVIGGDEGPVRIGIRHLDFELAVAPLLHGEVDVVEGRLEEPIIRLTLQPDRTLPALPSLPALQLDVRLERIAVVDGTLAVADPQSGRTFTADHLDFAVEAPSLAGPYKGSGTQGAADGRTKFRFSSAAARRTGTTTRTKLRFAFDETPRHPGLDLDGDMIFEPAGAENVAERFTGSAVATGHLRPEGRDPVAWRLAGPLRASPHDFGFGDGELRIGSGDLVLAASAEGTIADTPSLRAKLTAKQLDVDRLSGVAPGQAPQPPRLPGLAALRGLLASAAPPLPTSLDIDVASAIWGGEPLQDLSAHLSLNGPPPRSLRLAGEGPGGLHLDFDGNSLDGTDGGFDGRFALAATELPTALHWLRSVAPAEAAFGRDDPSFRTASLAGRVSAGGGGAELRDLTLGLDRSTLSGSARIAAGEAGRDAPNRVTADLSTPSLDIDALPDLRTLRGDALPFDLAVKLDAGSLEVARAGSGSLKAGHLRLDVTRTGQRLAVNDFAVDDLGGATVRAKGDLDGPAATLDLDLDATRLDGAAALLRQIAPGRAADALATRAGSLAPAKLHLSAGFSAGDRGRVVPSHLDLSGHVAATTLAVHLAPGKDGDGGSGVRLDATAEAPRGDSLLGQIGLPVAQAGDTALGAGRVSLAASGPVDGSLDTRVEAAFGATRLAVKGSFELFATGRGGSGAVTLSSADAMPLLHALGLASPDARASLPADLTGGLALGQTGIAVSDLKGRVDGVGVAGTLRWRSANGPNQRAGSGRRPADDPALTGSLDVERLALGNLFALALGPARPAPSGAAWSSEPFAAGLAEAPRSLVAVRAKALDLGFGLTARDATLDVATAPGSVAVTQAGGNLAGGRFAGEGTLRRDGRQATLAGTLTVAGAKLDIPALKAGITGKLDFAGGGASPLALVASLAGSGEATFADASLANINVRALPSVFAETENDTLAIDAESIGRAFEAAPLDRGQKAPALEAGTRQLAASLTSGVLALAARGEPVRAGPVAVTAEGGYDLRRLSGTLRVSETLTALPKGWSGPPPRLAVNVSGLPDGARRSLDVGDFTNAVAARAIARESARIETFEFDVRERALFNARLQFDHRREQDRLKVEADAKAAAEAARKAEAERRARAEAARLERERAKSDAAAPSGEPSQFAAPSPGTTADPAAAGRY